MTLLRLLLGTLLLCACGGEMGSDPPAADAAVADDLGWADVGVADSSPRPDAPAPFTLAVLPDTQFYSLYFPETFALQTTWIREQQATENILYALHEGDITHTNTPQEWSAAEQSIAVLDGALPYALAVGNHDMPSGTRDTALFDASFPVSRFSSWPTFGDVYEAGSAANCYHRFSAGGLQWLLLVLEFGPRAPVLSWANQVVAAHADHRVILLTHTYLYSDDTLHGSDASHIWTPAQYPLDDLPGGTSDGVAMWEQLVKPHANMTLVLNGHVLNDGAGRLVSTGDHGNRVFQLLANYQTEPNGGDGWLRLLRFEPAARRLSVRTYSPKLERHKRTTAHEFAFVDLALFDAVDSAPPSLDRVLAVNGPRKVIALFGETLEPVSAEKPAHYAIEPGGMVLTATLAEEGESVVLTTSPLEEGRAYTLTVRDLTDNATRRNRVDPPVSRAFSYASLLLDEGFDEKDLRGWTVVDEGSMDAPSSWTVTNGQLVQSSNIYEGDPVTTATNRKGTFVYWDAPEARWWESYELEATLLSQDDDGIGLLFRYRDEENYYKLELDSQRSFRRLVRVSGGQEVELATSSATGYEPQRAFEVRISAIGDVITVAIDGVPLFGGAITDSEAKWRMGTVGLYSWGNAGSIFDEIVVRAHPSP